jgi:preprotein translocase subunit SecA
VIRRFRPRKTGDRYIPLTAKDFEPLDKIVELETLQTEVYNKWGVKLDLEGRKNLKPLTVYEELAELVPARPCPSSASRVLDLIDRVLSAMVEESCPENSRPRIGTEGHQRRLQGAFPARPAGRSPRAG